MCLFSRWIFSVRAHFLQWLQKLCRIHSLVLCYVDKSHTSAFFLIFFGLLTFSLEEFHSQNFPLVFNMSQLRLLASLFCFLYVFLMNRILLSVSLCACSTLWSRRFGKRNAVVCDVLTRSARILSSRKCHMQSVHFHMPAHRHLIHVDYLLSSLRSHWPELFSLFQTPSLSLRSSGRFKVL